MTDINQLSSADTLTAGDLLPIWRTNNSDTRKTSLTALQAYMQSALTFSAGQFVVQYASPSATGFTVALLANTNNQWLILTPLAAYAAGTITFPLLSTVTDNQEVLIGVVVEIEKRQPRSNRLGHQFPASCAVDMGEVNSGLVRDIGENHGLGRYPGLGYGFGRTAGRDQRKACG